MRSQCLSMRQHSAGAQANPPSISTTFSFGKALEHALEHQARDGVLHAGRSGVVLLHVIGRPARPGRGVAAAEALHMQRDRPAGSAAPPRRSASSGDGRADRSSAARSGSGRRPDRRRAARSRSQRKPHPPAAPRCRRAAAARASPTSSSCQSLTARDSAAANSRLRSSMPPRLNCISMPYSTPLASRCCRRISSRSEPGGPCLRKRVDAHARRHHARPGQLPRQALPQMLAEGGHVLAPARRQKRMQIRRRAIGRMDVAVDDRQVLRRAGVLEPERSSHVLLACGGIIAQNDVVGDRPVAQTRIGLERVVDHEPAAGYRPCSPSGSTSSPSKCQCG